MSAVGVRHALVLFVIDNALNDVRFILNIRYVLSSDLAREKKVK